MYRTSQEKKLVKDKTKNYNLWFNNIGYRIAYYVTYNMFSLNNYKWLMVGILTISILFISKQWKNRKQIA